MTSSSSKFYIPLESIRGLAALCVVFYHISWITPLSNWGFIKNSYLMVDIFFVLSGFVIAHNYGHKLNNLTDLKKYVLLRIGRIYPLHFVTLLLVLSRDIAIWVAIVFFSFNPPAALETDNIYTFLSNLFLTHSLGLHGDLSFNRPSWSISSEFYTYLVFALMCLIVAKRRTRLTLYIVVCVASLSFLFIAKQSLHTTVDYGFIRTLFSFLVGVLCHTLYTSMGAHTRTMKWSNVFFNVFFGIIIMLLAVKEEGLTDFLIPPLVFLIILSGVSGQKKGFLKIFYYRPLVALGKISYSVYMNHFLIQWMIKAFLIFALGYKTEYIQGKLLVMTDSLYGSIFLLIYIVCVLSVSYLTFVFVEDPVRKKAKEIVKSIGIERTWSFKELCFQEFDPTKVQNR